MTLYKNKGYTHQQLIENLSKHDDLFEVDLSGNKLSFTSLPTLLKEYFPNVKTLIINKNEPPIQQKEFENFVLQLKEHVPNLEELEMDCLTVEQQKTIVSSLRSLKKINGTLIENIQPSKTLIETLEIIFQFKQELLKRIKSICGDESEQVFKFENYYSTITALIKHRLSICPKEKRYSIIQISKEKLFKAFATEIIAWFKTNKPESAEMIEQLLLVELQSYHSEMECSFKDDEIVPETFPFEHEDLQSIEQIEKDGQTYFTRPLERILEGESDDDEDYSIQPKMEKKQSIWKKIYLLIGKFIPPLIWIPEYRHHWRDLKGDLFAGLIVGIMLIPQGLGYAQIAGLPPVYGLYSAFIPILVYSLFGTSRQLAVGPVAMMSLLTHSAIASINPSNMEDYIAYSLMISLLSGAMQILLGIFRLGFLVNFLSHPVLSGFTSAAAITIGLSQLKHILGIQMANTETIIQVIQELVHNIADTYWPTLLASIVFLFLFGLFQFGWCYYPWRVNGKWKWFKFNLNRIPYQLGIVIIGTLFMYILKVATGDEGKNSVLGIKIIGDIPSGFPIPTFPIPSDFSTSKFEQVLILTIPIVLIGYIESISVAKVFAAKYNYQVDANQELIALGAANFFGGFFRAYPTTGGFSRTAVNAQAGAKTPLAGVISSLMILLVFLFLTPLFYYLPNALLAAMIIVAVLKLIDYKEAIFTWKTKKRDFFTLLVAFICTLLVGVEYGILIAASLSIALLIFRSSRPRIVLLGRIPGTTQFRNVKRWPTAITTPGVLAIRMDASLYFANISYLKDKVDQFIEKSKYPTHFVILDCSSINQVDSSAIVGLKQLDSNLKLKNITLYFASVKVAIQKVFERGGLLKEIPKERFYNQVMDAMRDAEKNIQQISKNEKELLLEQRKVELEEITVN